MSYNYLPTPPDYPPSGEMHQVTIYCHNHWGPGYEDYYSMTFVINVDGQPDPSHGPSDVVLATVAALKLQGFTEISAAVTSSCHGYGIDISGV